MRTDMRIFAASRARGRLGPMHRVVAARNAVAAAFVLNGFCFATWVARLPEIRDRLELSNSELAVWPSPEHELLGATDGAWR